MDSKEYLKSNFFIMYDELQQAIDTYVDNTCDTRALKRVEAFLVATIHTLVDYAERYMDNNDERIRACRYVNNSIKHLDGFVTLKKVEGGIEFPMSFPFSSEPITIRWKESDLKCKSAEQNKAYKNCFVGKEIIATLQPIVDIIKADAD